MTVTRGQSWQNMDANSMPMAAADDGQPAGSVLSPEGLRSDIHSHRPKDRGIVGTKGWAPVLMKI